MLSVFAVPHHHRTLQHLHHILLQAQPIVPAAHTTTQVQAQIIVPVLPSTVQVQGTHQVLLGIHHHLLASTPHV